MSSTKGEAMPFCALGGLSCESLPLTDIASSRRDLFDSTRESNNPLQVLGNQFLLCIVQVFNAPVPQDNSPGVNS